MRRICYQILLLGGDIGGYRIGEGVEVGKLRILDHALAKLAGEDSVVKEQVREILSLKG